MSTAERVEEVLAEGRRLLPKPIEAASCLELAERFHLQLFRLVDGEYEDHIVQAILMSPDIDTELAERMKAEEDARASGDHAKWKRRGLSMRDLRLLGVEDMEQEVKKDLAALRKDVASFNKMLEKNRESKDQTMKVRRTFLSSICCFVFSHVDPRTGHSRCFHFKAPTRSVHKV